MAIRSRRSRDCHRIAGTSQYPRTLRLFDNRAVHIRRLLGDLTSDRRIHLAWSAEPSLPLLRSRRDTFPERVSVSDARWIRLLLPRGS